jgi:hypothetical protein
MRVDWKSKERKGETFQKLTQYIIEKKHIYIYANPLTKVLGLHTTKGFYNQKHKLKTTTKEPSLCHLSILLRGRGRHGKISASS